jgi:sugar-specific transcriptional regulator TrmB
MHQKIPGENINAKDNIEKEKISITESIINYLQDFGLSEKEAKVYCILSKLGSASANEISAVTHSNRLQTYRSVKGLLDRGMVEISLERPRKYTPLKIENAISLLEQEAADRIVRLECKKPLLLQKWSELSDFPTSKASSTFRIIQGSKNVYKFAILLFESAENIIDISIKGSEITRWINEGAADLLQRKMSKQVITRIITENGKENAQAILRLPEFCDLRHVASLNTVPIILIDNKEALICLNGNIQGVVENAIWTNHPELVATMNSFFNILWSQAIKRKIMVKSVADKKNK